MKGITVFTQALIFALSFTVDAAPVYKPTGHEIRFSRGDDVDAAQFNPRGTCPTVDEIQQWLADNTSVGANTVFWTSGADVTAAEKLAAQVGGQYFYGAYGSQQSIWQRDCQPKDRLVKRMSQALAKQATGQTYIVLGAYAIGTDSVWLQDEYPNLSGVTITAVDDQLTKQEPYNPHVNPYVS
ncbi:uncharacterized protein B0I36DRAFT_331965 [Microdochium trichocladiopsis]|uniref:Uncharacterized protein n=1 Tax=Microdochium trichocladiopsis TaxID=1682393 RepID=A0A9P9BLS8_9PEZI|nr:uncharacterized protein B0I36DRAFT_331965 [Microdochium trichocladiopsis]KAH7024730.1 hypothetical protein B0I36DRAFT_331965 [Microdochium trichocladiopsis]